jgi:pilus assembly protein Flp/PilA
MTKLFARFLRDETGASAVEYALIVALIAVAIIGASSKLGTNIKDTFEAISNKVSPEP